MSEFTWPDIIRLLSLTMTFAGVMLAILLVRSKTTLTIAFPIALDFFLAAGLLRLSGDSTWQTIAIAAGIVGIRKLVSISIASSRSYTRASS